MQIPAHIVKQALELYLRIAYPPGGTGSAGVPAAIAARVAPIRALADEALMPLEMLERDDPKSSCSYALRLGQPLYPHMKMVVDPLPPSAVPLASGGTATQCRGVDFLLRVDTHDRHLHAPPDSPDAAWLASIRQSNKDLTERIEAAWAEAGLPTFKEFLRQQLQQRKNRDGIPKT